MQRTETWACPFCDGPAEPRTLCEACTERLLEPVMEWLRELQVRGKEILDRVTRLTELTRSTLEDGDEWKR